ncbi:MAG TPA: 16S rRNA (cytosine(1402)-N(4))-methyltransferase [Candidatus Magasanikbacteria bacterium]|nr:MAG: 16S rRNA (cytosine(1402)-N(4))-methyltransferase [Candidatus Magasanikbacteria bacterium RIFCSPLOWO2_02_FULL_47_16]OGH80111.1 MAG: 16S rRNA (cytosine(1402)-N(4))-methyltransferase [Candidatus Magasanikbacteria bacterium RIFCSPHIGHO2_02_FULL_48_18]OGH83190.1 MAG: 16S rRNA (cytosine(1402)-N(4))-methyltransferase [Candidatus Magasanikbacteria bacterium RIFCSPLOWO2_12_FULL_47_9b]HAZ28940.1 16S rRNA (cytosine(1402)-N(4))-methyltransferase [Candidatus Magasanikbacteria bacterium]
MRHIPVLQHEVLTWLNLKPGMNVVDATAGDAGHAEALLQHIAPNGKLLAIDADAESMLRVKNYLYPFGNRIVYSRENFVHLEDIIHKEQFPPIHAILFDLGWSTPQFEERGRGFSFQKDEPLDMRFDPLMECGTDGPYDGCTAKDLVNGLPQEELVRLFRTYGEEKLSREIAGAIVASRKRQEIATTGDLTAIVLSAYRTKLKSKKEIPWVGGLHPATKVFQALRIAVNDELGVLEKALPQAVNVLQPEGRLAVISFHSLEDRIVKHFFKSHEGKTLASLTKKPIQSSQEEWDNNPRARSAKLRVVKKL